MKHKLKYKDVVKKNGPSIIRRNTKQYIRPKKLKYNKPKGKGSSFHIDTMDSDKEIGLHKQANEAEDQLASSSSDSDEFDPLRQLRCTFGHKLHSKAIESSSEEENEKDSHDSYDEVESGSEQDKEESKSANSSDIEERTSDNEIQVDNLENFNDPFVKHFCNELHPLLLENLETVPTYPEVHKKTWPRLGNLIFQIPKCDVNKNISKATLDKVTYALPGSVPKPIDSKCASEELFIKSQIASNILNSNESSLKRDSLFTPLQQELFSILNNYQDLYYPHRSFDDAEEVRFIYCLHAVNHILKTRTKILHHNAKLSKKVDVPEEFRDQGLVRPKILLVVPFKDSAYKIINTIISILFKKDKENVIKRNRFKEDYTGNALHLPRKNLKPEDYGKIFCGNISDDFKIGLTVTKSSLKLYSDFYSSDIIVASPLGLRTVIGAEGESNRDFDFLTSIELLVLDQADIFLMQNWDHIIHLFNHMHLKPKDLHGTDVSRVRQWCLNLWAKFYRQTLIFSSVNLPELNSIFNKKCSNFAGKVKVTNPVDLGCMSKVFVQVPHIFYRFNATSPTDVIEKRFNFFVQKILPELKDSSMKQTLVYIPSYFDYVKIRNYFKREDIGFVQICEYSKEGKVARARDMFYHGNVNFLLYTERYHFFHRIRVKGIRNLVFYQPPNFPHFYSEISNLMQEANMNKKIGNMANMSVKVIYSKYDLLQLASIVGTERAAKMMHSDRSVHMMVTGAD